MSGANASGYLESRTMKTETPTVKWLPLLLMKRGNVSTTFAYAIERRTESMIYRILRKGEVRVNKSA